jgi:hypothetical protein
MVVKLVEVKHAVKRQTGTLGISSEENNTLYIHWLLRLEHNDFVKCTFN